MIAVYVTSSEAGAGKTALCCGLGRRLQEKGKSVGYVRVARDASQGDRDAAAVRDILRLGQAARTAPASPAEAKKAAQEASAGRDILLVEGLDGLGGGQAEQSLSQDLARALGATVLPVVAHTVNQSWTRVGESLGKFGSPVLGLVVNKVPARRLEAVGGAVLKAITAVKQVVIVPEDRGLMGLTVAEVAGELGAEVAGPAVGMDALVENIMVNAFALDPGAVYFGRRENKAVVSRGERPDMHLAALRTSVRCLVLTGGARPIESVASVAEEKKVPVLVTKQDTLGALDRLQAALAAARFHGESRIQRLIADPERSADFGRLYQALGV